MGKSANCSADPCADSPPDLHRRPLQALRCNKVTPIRDLPGAERKAGDLPDRGSPSVRGRRLAAELRRLRERTGLTGEEVADRLGWSGSKVSRIELHRIGVKQADLRRLLALYGVGEGHRDELLALASESRKKSGLERATAQFPQVAPYVFAEAEAESIWNWEPQIIPGLLQTEDYARALAEVWLVMFPGPTSE